MRTEVEVETYGQPRAGIVLVVRNGLIRLGGIWQNRNMGLVG